MKSMGKVLALLAVCAAVLLITEGCGGADAGSAHNSGSPSQAVAASSAAGSQDSAQTGACGLVTKADMETALRQAVLARKAAARM